MTNRPSAPHVHEDKTGAPATVIAEADRFSISVRDKLVGFAEFVDRDGRRVFTHTEVLPAYQGRGLATIVVAEAVRATREAGLHIVPACSMVAAYLAKHPEFDGVVDAGR